MTRFILLVATIMCFGVCHAQEKEVVEPDFIGEALVIDKKGETISLEKVNAQIKVADQLMGYQKRMHVRGGSSPIRLKKGQIQLIVKAYGNEVDPMTIIKVFKFFGNKKERKAIVWKQNELTGKVSNNQYNNVAFNGKKYGEASYLLTLNINESGEYGIIIDNPINDNMLIVSCFGVD